MNGAHDRIPLAVTLAAFLAFLFVCEHLVPLRRSRRPLLARLVVNLCLSASAFAASLLFVRPAALAALRWASDRPFGLVHVLPMPSTARLALSFLLMDLTFYWWHAANHRIGFLWRFHNVHHIDPALDVSTAFRFHFGEVLLSSAFRALQISAIGVSAPAFAVYELVFQANTLFHHSNVRLPVRLERLLNLVLVTPRMHGTHHSQVRAEATSNYSVVFSWWDRLHRTRSRDVPPAELVIGVPAYTNPADNALGSALLMPFRPQRDYWRRF